jgi:hypothetical protein
MAFFPLYLLCVSDINFLDFHRGQTQPVYFVLPVPFFAETFKKNMNDTMVQVLRHAIV